MLQACFLNELATFGIGENFKNRRIVAVTPVQCLLIPRYWLWQRNTDYVWSKVQQYLNNHIPTTEALFREFVENRRWQEHRRKLVEDVRSANQKVNYNTIHNVPYSIRITDDLDYKYRQPKKKHERRRTVSIFKN